MAVVDQVADPPAVGAALQHVRGHGSEWFPELDPRRTRVTVGARIPRVRCVLYRLDLTDDRNRASVMAKVRHSPPHAPVAAGRPTLQPAGPLPDADLARLEFAGLGMVAGADGDPWLQVRPLALLDRHATVVMDHVTGPTLRHAQSAAARIRSPSVPRVADSCWAAAGAWLRRYHGERPDGVVPTTRTPRRSDVLSLYARLADHLVSSGGDARALDRIAATAAELAERHLPADLPLVTGHGDFAPRNVLVGATGRIAVIDPLPRWQVPPYEDVGRFLVNMRCPGPQVASGGLALRPAQLQRYEDRFLAGYYGSAELTPGLRAYTVLILLDKWSAAATTARSAVLRRWFGRHYLREATRLLLGADAVPARSR